MSKAWSARSATERERLEAEFVLRHCVDMLLDEAVEQAESMTEGGPRPPKPQNRPSFARLCHALRSGGPLPEELRAALAAEPALRADLSLFVERCALAHLPRAAAAAGAGALERREAGGCTLRLISSRAGDDQVYLLIELPDGGADAPDADDGATSRAAMEERPPSSGRGSGGGVTGTPAPGRLIVKTAAGEFLMEDLPLPEARTIRLLKAADDPVVRAIGEPASEIFLL